MKLDDLTGLKFGKLKVIERDKTSKRVKWICQCECGKIKSVAAGHLKSGATTSCGCIQRIKASESNLTHGKSRTSLHNRWKALKQRCLNVNNSRYKDYGGRGIDICHEWLTFENFERWALENGYSKELTLDRIDNDKGYYPENCRWTNVLVQNRNKRNVNWVIDGDRKIKLRDVSDITGICRGTLYDRLTKQKRKNLKEIVTQQQYMLITSHSNEKLFEGVETR